MATDRRRLLQSAVALLAGSAIAITQPARARTKQAVAHGADNANAGLDPDSKTDQTAALQAAIERSAASGRLLQLPAGQFFTKTLGLPSGAHIVGVPGATRLTFIGEGAFLIASHAEGLWLENLIIDGALEPLEPETTDGLITLADCPNLTLRGLRIERSLINGLSLRRCSGRVDQCDISQCGATGLFSLDAAGLAITGNVVSDIGNNGIQVWRSSIGDDGAMVSGNRVSKIGARAGGNGQNGNGINVFRAGRVQVTDNHITDCAFSAIRANSASNCLIGGNTASGLGEVAIYCEFAFQGAVIANNIVDGASVGISVTNFNEGGRLATVSGNLLRNLHRTSASGEDQGIGISVEADTAVTGNVIEAAERIGIQAGWGSFRRDVSVTGNIVRQAPIGIALSSDPAGGAVLVAQNLISGASEGGIRMMDHHTALGADLAHEAAPAGTRLAISGNVSV